MLESNMRAQEHRFMLPTCDVPMWWCLHGVLIVAGWQCYESKCFSNTLVKISVDRSRQSGMSLLEFRCFLTMFLVDFWLGGSWWSFNTFQDLPDNYRDMRPNRGGQGMATRGAKGSLRWSHSGSAIFQLSITMKVLISQSALWNL